MFSKAANIILILRATKVDLGEFSSQGEFQLTTAAPKVPWGRLEGKNAGCCLVSSDQTAEAIPHPQNP